MKKPAKNALDVHSGILHALGHDAKQPLGLIRAYSYYIKQSLSPADNQLVSFTDKINTQVDVLAKMLSNLAESIKLQNDQVTVSLKKVEILQLIRNSIATTQTHYPETEIVAKLPSADKSIEVDPFYMDLALTNILENAIHFSKNAKKVAVKVEINSQAVSIWVSNTSSKISKNDLAHVFEQFYRGKNAKESSVKGLGLGLSVSKIIIEMHAGTILMDSDTDQTVVQITLPCTPK